MIDKYIFCIKMGGFYLFGDFTVIKTPFMPFLQFSFVYY